MRRSPKCAVIALVLIAGSLICQGDIVARAEADNGGKGAARKRVVRDKEKNVVRLFLHGMKLSPEEFADLCALKHLQTLNLCRSNVSDADLVHLRQCTNLTHLNLSSTEVTDVAIDTILEIENLKTLCLLDVNISLAGIDKLMQRNQNRQVPLVWSYRQRRR